MIFVRSVATDRDIWLRLVVLLPLSVAVGVALARRFRRPRWLGVAACASVSVILGGTLAPLGDVDPLPMTWAAEHFPPRIGRCLIDAPFLLRPADPWEVWSNVVVFVPPAVCWVLLVGRSGPVFTALSLGSLGIELVQSGMLRVCSSADWVQNSAGAALGVLCGVLLARAIARRRPRGGRPPGGPGPAVPTGRATTVLPRRA